MRCVRLLLWDSPIKATTVARSWWVSQQGVEPSTCLRIPSHTRGDPALAGNPCRTSLAKSLVYRVSRANHRSFLASLVTLLSLSVTKTFLQRKSKPSRHPSATSVSLLPSLSTILRKMEAGTSKENERIDLRGFQMQSFHTSLYGIRAHHCYGSLCSPVRSLQWGLRSRVFIGVLLCWLAWFEFNHMPIIQSPVSLLSLEAGLI